MAYVKNSNENCEMRRQGRTQRTKFSCFQAATQRKDVVSNGTRLATVRRDVPHESNDDKDDWSWWLTTTKNPRRQSRSRRAEEKEAAIGAASLVLNNKVEHWKASSKFGEELAGKLCIDSTLCTNHL